MAAAVAAATVGGCSGSTPTTLDGAPTGGELPASNRVTFGAAQKLLVMQILAHPDDDLFFMNPDTVNTIRRDVPIVSVYVTGGGSYGVNRPPGGPMPRPDVSAYVSSRQQGLRQSYARMLGADIFARWTRTVIGLPGGGEAEVDTLVHGARRAELVFLNIDMHNKLPGGGWVGMPQLWARPGVAVRTVPLPDSPVRRAHTYRRQSLIDTLVFLFEKYLPTLIRTLDPDPDTQVHDAHYPRGSDQPGYSDHPDHTATALFAWRAMAQWSDTATAVRGKAPVFLTETYRGYYNQRWPYNLPDESARVKTVYLDAYGGDPAWHCGNAAGCGDYSVGQGAALKSRRGWVRSTHNRYPTWGPQALAGKDGRLVVYGVLGTRAARWVETSPGSGAWSRPTDLGGGPLAPALSVVKAADGRELVLGLRFSGLEGAAEHNTREIVLLEPVTPSGGATDVGWRSLGNPETDPVRGRRVGPPVALTGRDGRVHIFVRNASKGLSTRVRDTTGRWSGWQLLAGGQVQEGLTAALDDAGRIHVFAAGRNAVHHWTQDSPTAMLRFRPLRLAAPPGDAPDAVAARDGSLLLAYRVPATAEIMVERLSAGFHGRWTPLAQVKNAGFGSVSLLGGGSASAGAVLGVRGPDGGALLVRGDHAPARGPVSAFAVGRPAVLTEGPGTALVSFGLDAAPRVTRSRPTGVLTQLADGGGGARLS